jgi:hypothetical protein
LDAFFFFGAAAFCLGVRVEAFVFFVDRLVVEADFLVSVFLAGVFFAGTFLVLEALLGLAVVFLAVVLLVTAFFLSSFSEAVFFFDVDLVKLSLPMTIPLILQQIYYI